MRRTSRTPTSWFRTDAGRLRAGLAALAALVLVVGCTELPPSASAPPAPDSVEAVIDLSDQQVTVTRSGGGASETRVWPVSTGRPGYATPTGTFRPFMLSPNHRSSLYEDAPMPWSVFFNRDIAVHGTYEIASLGRAVSHGCVRLQPNHAETFFRWVQEVGKTNTRIIVQQ